jgi:hypothetical protein
MMGEGIARNMYSRLEINKSRIVASCWLSLITDTDPDSEKQISLREGAPHTHGRGGFVNIIKVWKLWEKSR